MSLEVEINCPIDNVHSILCVKKILEYITYT